MAKEEIYRDINANPANTTFHPKEDLKISPTSSTKNTLQVSRHQNNSLSDMAKVSHGYESSWICMSHQKDYLIQEL
jgi:hypothetical protein